MKQSPSPKKKKSISGGSNVNRYMDIPIWTVVGGGTHALNRQILFLKMIKFKNNKNCLSKVRSWGRWMGDSSWTRGWTRQYGNAGTSPLCASKETREMSVGWVSAVSLRMKKTSAAGIKPYPAVSNHGRGFASGQVAEVGEMLPRVAASSPWFETASVCLSRGCLCDGPLPEPLYCTGGGRKNADLHRVPGKSNLTERGTICYPHVGVLCPGHISLKLSYWPFDGECFLQHWDVFFLQQPQEGTYLYSLCY